MLAAALSFSLFHPAAAAELAGPAQVIDGDGLVVDGREIRLSGIDAPEWNQVCQREGGKWYAGREAKAWLDSLVAGRTVSCSVEQTIHSSKGARTLATCYVGGQDIGAAAVEAGWAVAYTRYSKRYVGQEAAALSAGRGMHAGQCDQPEAWRHRSKTDE